MTSTATKCYRCNHYHHPDEPCRTLPNRIKELVRNKIRKFLEL